MKPAARRFSKSRGSTLIEFAITGFLVSMMLFSVLEMGRMILVYTDISNAARAAARYAIVHGALRTGTGTNGPSGPGDNPAEVVQMVRNFASAGPIDLTKLTITINYIGGNNVGNSVNVLVSYAYDPFIGYFPFSVNLSASSRGVIVF